MALFWLSIPFLLGLLCFLIYQFTCLWELRYDSINPFDLKSRMKSPIMAEFIVQGLLCFLYLVTGHWFLTLLSVPYLCYNLRLYMRREHLIDVKKIFNLLDWKNKETLWKIAHTSLLLVISLFWVIWKTLEEDERTLQMVTAVLH